MCHDTCKLDACVLPSHDSISAKQAGPDERIFVFLLALPFCLLIVDLLSAHSFAISTISARMRGYALARDGPPSLPLVVGCNVVADRKYNEMPNKNKFFTIELVLMSPVLA